MKPVIERFLRYVEVDTASDSNSTTYPSTEKQKDLGRLLVEEMQAMGLEDVQMDSWGYVTGTLPGNTARDVPVLGLLAHMDTSEAVSGKDVKPRLVENYDGGDVLLNAEQNVVLSPADFPELAHKKGQTLIVTDGTTLLGGDNKAGIAAILSAVQHLQEHPEIEHGKIRIGFTPDEEVGAGVAHFDVPAFGAKFAYTVDGGGEGEFEYENFNACTGKVKVNGRSVHPGMSKNTLVNAATILMQFHGLLPAAEKPEFTEGYEGFYHLVSMSGDCELAQATYIVRDHSAEKFAKKKAFMRQAAELIDAQYGQGTLELDLIDSYMNMRTMDEPHPYIIETALKAYEMAGVEPRIIPVRGGTDGARLSYMGLPCPNIFTGDYNAHGRFEYVVAEELVKAVYVLVNVAQLTAELPA